MLVLSGTFDVVLTTDRGVTTIIEWWLSFYLELKSLQFYIPLSHGILVITLHKSHLNPDPL